VHERDEWQGITGVSISILGGRMTQDPRYVLITSFLAIPKSEAEQRLLVNAVRHEKELASKNMDVQEHLGALSFHSWLDSEDEEEQSCASNGNYYRNYEEEEEEDLLASDSSSVGDSEQEQSRLPSRFFTDFECARNSFEYWAAIEQELCSSIGFQHYFYEYEVQLAGIEATATDGGHKPQRASLLLRRISNNLISHVQHESDMLGGAKEDIQLIQQDVYDYGPEDRSDHDDEWFSLQDDLEAAEHHLSSLEMLLPLCWPALQDFSLSYRAKQYIPKELRKYIDRDDRKGFAEACLEMEVEAQKLASVLDENGHGDEDF